MSAVWRLILDGPADGAWNMAVDRALLRSRHDGTGPATLRLYRWERPTVTLGRFQDAAGVDAAARERYGVDVVRRATGGRGVLHDDELTYAVVASVADGLPRGVAASYRVLCGALAEAYRSLGVPAELTSRERGSGASGACYLHATKADLSLGAAKLSGSAQVWAGDAVLQHGSFVRSRDTGREAAVFRLDDVAARRLAETTATIGDVLGARPSDEDLAAAVVRGFEAALGVRFAPGGLTPEERADAGSLLGEARVERT